MKRALLTGGTGLIGQYAIEPLVAEGFEVHAVARTPACSGPARWIAADLLDVSALASLFEQVRPEFLLHLAWDTTPGKYLEDNANFRWLTSSLEMLRLFALHGGRRAVLAGTCFEYAFSRHPLREDDPLAPASVYAECKDHLNRLASLFCRRNHVSFGWGRIFFVYGKNEHAGRLTAAVIDAVRKNEPLTIKGGSLARDYMYAKDAAAALAGFLASPVEGTVNICTGVGVSLEEYCRELAGSMGRGDIPRFGDEPGRQPPMIVGDPGRLRNDVGFSPRYDLRRGFAEILEGTIRG